MASNIMGGSRTRMSGVVSGDKPRGRSIVSTASGAGSPDMPTAGLGSYVKAAKDQTRVAPTRNTPRTYAQPATKNVPRSYVSPAPKTLKNILGGRGVMALSGIKRFASKNAPKATVTAQPAVAMAPVPVKKTVVKPTAQVISTTTNEKLSPTPARMAVNARTGNTTGFTTGKTTGTTASKPGVAGKTAQSSYSRQMANAMNRTNQPAGPMGGGGGRIGGGTGPSRSSGGGSLGGARGRIGEPAGSKR